MTDIEQKALALWNAVRAEREYTYKHTAINRVSNMAEALCRAIEQHEDFKQRVSFALKTFKDGNMHTMHDYLLEPFIIPTPKPDPLLAAMNEVIKTADVVQANADQLRAALEARGLEIREKGQ